jgi:hypothetical protein
MILQRLYKQHITYVQVSEDAWISLMEENRLASCLQRIEGPSAVVSVGVTPPRAAVS